QAGGRARVLVAELGVAGLAPEELGGDGGAGLGHRALVQLDERLGGELDPRRDARLVVTGPGRRCVGHDRIIPGADGQRSPSPSGRRPSPQRYGGRVTQRFNPPPGWDVPPGFAPTADWQPDPSWPPAPQGWQFWVDDAAAQPVPPSGAGPYGSAQTPYGAAADAPPGAYGSTAPGSAQAAIAEARYAGARRSTFVGAGIFVVGVLINVWSLGSGGRGTLWWGILLVGLLISVRGLIDMNRAKKELAATQGPFGLGAPAPGAPVDGSAGYGTPAPGYGAAPSGPSVSGQPYGTPPGPVPPGPAAGGPTAGDAPRGVTPPGQNPPGL